MIIIPINPCACYLLAWSWFDYDNASLWFDYAHMRVGNACGTTVLWVVGSHGWPVVWYGMELLAPRSTTTHLPFVLLWMDVMMVAWCFAGSAIIVSVQQRKEKIFSAAAGDTGVSSPIAARSRHLVSDWPCSCY
jgi:hypothetical protein